MKKDSVEKEIRKSMKTIERVWAEDGFVHIQSKNGETKILDYKEAALRAKAINDNIGRMPEISRQKVFDMISMFISAAREAKHQMTNPETNKQKEIIKLFESKAPVELLPQESMLLDLSVQFPMIAEDDLKAVIRELSRGLPRDEALNILGALNRKLMFEKFGDPALGIKAP